MTLTLSQQVAKHGGKIVAGGSAVSLVAVLGVFSSQINDLRNEIHADISRAEGRSAEALGKLDWEIRKGDIPTMQKEVTEQGKAIAHLQGVLGIAQNTTTGN